jgi:hypothetical protein
MTSNTADGPKSSDISRCASVLNVSLDPETKKEIEESSMDYQSIKEGEEILTLYQPPSNVKDGRPQYLKSMDEYKKMYEESIKTPEVFWAKVS